MIAAGATSITKAEGVWTGLDGSVWFVSSRGDGPDNITASPQGFMLACTDGEDDQVAGRHHLLARRQDAVREHPGPTGADIRYHRALVKRRADYGQAIDGFFKKQPAELRPVLVELRKLVESTIPDAASSIKWGMPVYTVGGEMVCALGAHKAHVNLILAGPPDAFRDPRGRLTGAAKGGRHLKLTSVKELPRAEVRGWLKTAADLARAK